MKWLRPLKTLERKDYKRVSQEFLIYEGFMYAFLNPHDSFIKLGMQNEVARRISLKQRISTFFPLRIVKTKLA